MVKQKCASKCLRLVVVADNQCCVPCSPMKCAFYSRLGQLRRYGDAWLNTLSHSARYPSCRAGLVRSYHSTYQATYLLVKPTRSKLWILRVVLESAVLKSRTPCSAMPLCRLNITLKPASKLEDKYLTLPRSSSYASGPSSRPSPSY